MQGGQKFQVNLILYNQYTSVVAFIIMEIPFTQIGESVGCEPNFLP